MSIGTKPRILFLVISLVLSWAVYLAVQVARFAHQTDLQQADVAIVLGNAVNGNRPSPVFEQRLLHAISLYQRGIVPALILTGGVPQDSPVAESVIARNYCLSQGVSAQDIFIETNSHSTEENLLEAHHILNAQRFRRALIVSDPLHERRALTIARDLGIDAYPSPTPTTKYVGIVSRGRFLVRETFLYGRYLLRRSLT